VCLLKCRRSRRDDVLSRPKHFFFSEATVTGAAYIGVLENLVLPRLEQEEAELLGKMAQLCSSCSKRKVSMLLDAERRPYFTEPQILSALALFFLRKCRYIKTKENTRIVPICLLNRHLPHYKTRTRETILTKNIYSVTKIQHSETHTFREVCITRYHFSKRKHYQKCEASISCQFTQSKPSSLFWTKQLLVAAAYKYEWMNECVRGQAFTALEPRPQWSMALPLFKLFPQQPRASNDAQDFRRGDVKIVTWFHKVLTQVT
jgi:hypothetical protein